MDEEFDSGSSISYPGMGYSEDALKLRLDTSGLMESIEMFLRGERVVIENNAVVKRKMGEALANDNGVQTILQILNMIVNKDMVQGNLTEDEINQIVSDVKLDLAWLLMTNVEEYGIKRTNRKYIVRNIERSVKIYLSRTKDNKERESFGMRVQHQSTQTSQKRGFSLPFSNG